MAYSQTIKAHGLAASGFYSSPMPHGISCRQYLVWFEIKNTGNKDLVFDTLKVFWQCKGGTLPRTTVKTVGENPDPFGKMEIEDFVIKPNESHDFEFDTDGYTNDLLDNKGKKPIYFIFILVKKNKLVVGPYMVKLPDLKDMPQRHFIKSDDDELFKLKFTKGLPEF
ncbi:MAG: hypothetical protein ABIG10_03490 [bacterium]